MKKNGLANRLGYNAPTMMKTKLPLLLLTFSLLLSACGGQAFAAPQATSTPLATASPLPSPTATAAPSLTPTVTPTFTPSPVPTPTWVKQGPDAVSMPILMYHHVEEHPIVSNYRVSAARFDEQLKLLHDWEYTTITTTMLVDAITQGTELPPRPIIITFDDGNLDNYTVAFPIMKKYGFTGVLYIPYNYIGVDNHMTVDQIKEMAAAGWEIGSHSMSHPNLIGMPGDRLRAEIVDSRTRMEELLGVPILTFAYPFGDVGSSAVDYVKFAGYIAGMGASGFQWQQGTTNLFVLQRCEIKDTDITNDPRYFPRFLPWWGDAPFLSTDTPTPPLAPTQSP